MLILISPDSFKECMTASEACNIIAEAISTIMPHAVCIKSPLADGGEGSMQILSNATNGKIFHETVKDPLGNDILAPYAILGNSKTAVVEMASASGSQLVPVEKRNPLITTSYGTGQLIKAALQCNVEKIIITLGGSATNDGGVGMLQALGISFLDKNRNEIGFGGGALAQINTIDFSQCIINKYPHTQIEIATDVNNPLTGTNGASVIYSPQKGATPQMVVQLEANLLHYAEKIKAATGMDVRNIPGAGAAGGAAAGLIAFTNTKLVSGAELIMTYTGIEDQIAKADLIITGEGSIDKQTLQGKAIHSIVQIAKTYNKPVIAFVGKIADGHALEKINGLDVVAITPPSMPIAKALQKGKGNLMKTVMEKFEKIKLELQKNVD